jgi:hypothetical protein
MAMAAAAGITNRVNSVFKEFLMCLTFMEGSLMSGITEMNIRNIHQAISNPRATALQSFIYMNIKR